MRGMHRCRTVRMSRRRSIVPERHEYLPEEEQRALLAVWRQGAPKNARLAGERLLQTNYGFILSEVCKYLHPNHPLWDDAFQEALLGFTKGMHKFDPGESSKLTGYCSWWIRAYVLKFLRDNASLVRIGKTQAEADLYFKARKADPNSPGAVGELARRMLPAVDIDDPETGMVFAAAEPDALETLAERRESTEAAQRIEHALRGLKPREADILRRTMLGYDKESLESVGDAYGFSRERARQIRDGALGKVLNTLGSKRTKREVLDNWKAFGLSDIEEQKRASRAACKQRRRERLKAATQDAPEEP